MAKPRGDVALTGVAMVKPRGNVALTSGDVAIILEIVCIAPQPLHFAYSKRHDAAERINLFRMASSRSGRGAVNHARITGAQKGTVKMHGFTSFVEIGKRGTSVSCKVCY